MYLVYTFSNIYILPYCLRSMRRKLIQHGLSSLTVSLPKKWTSKNNLKKGEEVEVSESGSSINISAKKHYEKRKIEIDVSNSASMIKRIVGAAFKSGYDEIDIRFSSFDELKQVQELTREQFSGFEIMDQTKEKVLLKNISENNFEEFNNVLRRFFLVLGQVAEESAQAIEKSDFKWMKSISLMKIESDKFADYCRRAINMGYELESKRGAPLYTLVEQLEKSVDRYADLCSYLSHEKLEVCKEIKSLASEISSFETCVYNLFYKFDLKKVIELGEIKINLQKKLDEAAVKCSKKEIKAILLMDRILNLIFDVNGPLMAIYI